VNVALVAGGIFAATTIAPGAASATLPPGGDVAPDYGDPAAWLCSPSGTDCADNGDRVIVAPDGSLDPAQHLPAEDRVEPEIDCFYVYPTISMDQSVNSDLAPHDEETWVMRNQAAPLSPSCRVVAPIYRQLTIPGLGAAVSGLDIGDARAMAYGDVLAAWQYYLEHDNDGRGVILVGHSQGAGHLNRLIRDEIDDHPEVRDLIVAAYLAGSAVQVPVGEDVGGDFENVPLCRAADQTACVVTWASFRATAPPPADSLFGRGGEGTEAGCTNPAALGGGPAELQAYFPANRGANILSGGGDVQPWADPAVIDTAAYAAFDWVEVPGLLTAECIAAGGFNYLEITINADPADPRVDDIPGNLTPQWGLHLVDMNLVMGDLVALAESQAAAWLAAR
jgi:hypothetical protein